MVCVTGLYRYTWLRIYSENTTTFTLEVPKEKEAKIVNKKLSVIFIDMKITYLNVHSGKQYYKNLSMCLLFTK